MKINFTKLTSNAKVQLPASKSISNRVLIIQALCKQSVAITNVSNSADTIALQEMLASELNIVNANEAGTAFRFMTALLCVQNATTQKIITGAPRLRERPIADLVDALNSMGAAITYADKYGFAPLKIQSVDKLKSEVSIAANVSSQFISALCLIAPSLPNGLKIHFNTTIFSLPYIKMTLQLMQYFGVQSSFTENKIHILPQSYVAKPIAIEADWSAATFIYCALLIMQEGTIEIDSLQFTGIQGDEIIADWCKQHFGIQQAITQTGVRINLTKQAIFTALHFDCTDCPDLAIPLIVACAIRYPQTTFIGLQSLLVKESNRIEALQTELAKIGLVLTYQNDILSFSGNLDTNFAVTFDSYNDHRIAMALALVAIVHPNININDAHVVNKSFPDYWQQLQNLGFKIN